MAKRLLLDSPAIARAVKGGNISLDSPRYRRRKTSLENTFFLPGGFSEHQFLIAPTGATSISVINGINPGSDACGSINGIDVAKTDFTFPATNGKYWIYVQGPYIYALKSTIAYNDILPTLFIGTVTITDGAMSVYQYARVVAPHVPVQSNRFGNCTISWEETYENFEISRRYYIAGSYLHNGILMQIPDTELPDTSSEVLAYVEKLFVGNNIEAVTGVAIDTVPTGAEYSVIILRYHHDGGGVFDLEYANPVPQTFSFTTYLTDAEA